MAVTRRIEPWSELLQAGRADERLVREAYEGAREPRLEAIPADLHPAVRDGLQRAGIDALYAHQAEALEAAWAGPTIVTTGTASGKSLCFSLPTLDVLCGDTRARARVSEHRTSSVGKLKHSDLPEAVPVVTIVGPAQAASSASA